MIRSARSRMPEIHPQAARESAVVGDGRSACAAAWPGSAPSRTNVRTTEWKCTRSASAIAAASSHETTSRRMLRAVGGAEHAERDPGLQLACGTARRRTRSARPGRPPRRVRRRPWPGSADNARPPQARLLVEIERRQVGDPSRRQQSTSLSNAVVGRSVVGLLTGVVDGSRSTTSAVSSFASRSRSHDHTRLLPVPVIEHRPVRENRRASRSPRREPSRRVLRTTALRAAWAGPGALEGLVEPCRRACNGEEAAAEHASAHSGARPGRLASRPGGSGPGRGGSTGAGQACSESVKPRSFQ